MDAAHRPHRRRGIRVAVHCSRECGCFWGFSQISLIRRTRADGAGSLAEAYRVTRRAAEDLSRSTQRISRQIAVEDLSASAAACLACGLDDWHLNGERAPFTEQAEGH